MIASPFLPYFPAEAARGVQDGVAGRAPGRWSFHGLALLQVGMIACAQRCAMAS